MAEHPQIGRAQIRLLERLCRAVAVSGDEKQVRTIVLEQIEAHADEINVDAVGNVLAVRRGSQKPALKVMLAAHMDEVGFMITHDEGGGIFRFETVGGLDVRQLAGKSVVVGQSQVPGVIGAKPVHLSTPSERRNSIPLDNLRIDIGSEAKASVRPGDRAVFSPNFQPLGAGLSRSLRGKAMDDRVGVATLIELFKYAPAHIDLLAAFTVQEEVGLRGATVAGYTLAPDLAIVLECTPAQDLPHWDVEEENTRYNARLGHGPAIYRVDRATLSDSRLFEYLAGVADEHKIRYQFRQAGSGGTDAGAIHKTRAGVPSVSVGVPGRYLHTAASLIRLADWRGAFQLIHAALHGLDAELLSRPRRG